MRLLILARSLGYGGAERQLTTLAIGLRDRGHHVVVAVFYGGGPLAAELLSAGIPVVDLEKRDRWEVTGFVRRLTRLVRQERPQLVHGYLPGPNLAALLAKVVRPSSKAVWGVRASDLEDADYGRFQRSVFRISAALAPMADLIIVNSRAGIEYHRRHRYPQRRMLHIANGVDVERFQHGRPAAAQVRREWGIPETVPLIGMVGRLDPMKDHLTFIRAASLALLARDDLRFVCVGDGAGAYAEELREHARRLGVSEKLLWVHGRDDMPAVYSAFDIVTSASAYGEGFPNVVGEAMAARVPSVVTDVGDSRWVLGDPSRVIPPRDPSRLAAAWLRLMELSEDERIALGSRDASRVSRLFSLDRLIERSEQALEHILSRRVGSVPEILD